MIPIGTLHLDPAPDDLERRSIFKYESYKAVISVKRPNEEMIRILGRTTTILSIFELVLTIPLVWFVWNPLCFLLVIPLIFRVAALPTKCVPIQSSPLFVTFHSMVIGTQALVMFGFSYLSAQAYHWSNDKGYTFVCLTCITFILALRFGLTLLQYKHLNIVRLNRILASRGFIFTLT